MKKKGYLCIILAAFIFSTAEISLKFIGGSVDPIQITFIRFFIGGLVLLPFALSELKKRDVKLTKTDIKHFLILGFVCIVLSMNLFQMAIENTMASVVAVVFSGNPIFVSIIAFFVIKEPVRKHNIAALIIEVFGIIAIINPFNNQISILGITLAILAGAFYADFAVMSKSYAGHLGSVIVTCFSNIFGSLMLLALILFGRIDIVGDVFSAVGLSLLADVPVISGITLEILPIVLYLCIGVSALGTVCYVKGMVYVSAQAASLTFFLKPIIAPVLAFLILSEHISLNMFIGILFFLAASLTSTLPEMKK